MKIASGAKRLAQFASQQVINGRFINDASVSTPDEAIFELSGFVARELTEKVNKEDEGSIFMKWF